MKNTVFKMPQGFCMFIPAKPNIMLNNEGIIRTSEIIITQLPYRSEFILADQIRKTANSNTEFKTLGYDFDGWIGTPYTQDIDYIIGQLIDGNIIKHTRSIFNENTGRNDEYYVLTKTGRKMKGSDGLRTFEKLNAHRKIKRETKELKEHLEITMLQNQVAFQEINNNFISRQSELIDNQIAANEIAKVANIYIAVFTGLGGLYALLQLLITLIPMNINNRTTIISCAVGGSTVAGIIGYLRLHRIHRKLKKQ